MGTKGKQALKLKKRPEKKKKLSKKAKLKEPKGDDIDKVIAQAKDDDVVDTTPTKKKQQPLSDNNQEASSNDKKSESKEKKDEERNMEDDDEEPEVIKDDDENDDESKAGDGDEKVDADEKEDDENKDEEMEEVEEEGDEIENLPEFISDGRYRNKQRCLVLCSRGVTARLRHLMEDLRTLMPHCKKESKLDPGADGVGRAVNDIAEMKSCNTVLFFECRKRQDAFMWVGRVGHNTGPSVRFHLSNIHTMDELRLTGNCMKGSRPILSFDSSFEKFTHLKLIRALFIDVFGTPRGHPKSKPFVDRVMAFYYADNKIWVRNYQILEEEASNAQEARQTKKESGAEAATSLVEIGPRFVLHPIRIFRGSFGGQTLYKNLNYVSPNEIRAQEKRGKGNAYAERKASEMGRKERKRNLVLPKDPLASVFD